MDQKDKQRLLDFCKKYWTDVKNTYPHFILEATEDHIIIDEGIIEGRKSIARKITIPHTVQFYKNIAPFLYDNLTDLKEYLHLGDIEGYYREIGLLAKFSFYWFRYINNAGLIKEASEQGLENVAKIHSSTPKDQGVLF